MWFNSSEEDLQESLPPPDACGWKKIDAGHYEFDWECLELQRSIRDTINFFDQRLWLPRRAVNHKGVGASKMDILVGLGVSARIARMCCHQLQQWRNKPPLLKLLPWIMEKNILMKVPSSSESEDEHIQTEIISDIYDDIYDEPDFYSNLDF